MGLYHGPRHHGKLFYLFIHLYILIDGGKLLFLFIYIYILIDGGML